MILYLLNKKANHNRLAFFISFLLSFSALAMKKRSFTVKEEMKKPLVSLMDLSVNLHRAVYDQNAEQMDLIILKMIQQTTQLKQNANTVLPYHEQSYLNKLLRSLQFNLEAFRKSNRYKKNYINSINRKLTYIAHIYGLKKYTVFFCSKDRSVWMQTNRSKPLHLSHTSCGIPVSR